MGLNFRNDTRPFQARQLTLEKTYYKLNFVQKKSLSLQHEL